MIRFFAALILGMTPAMAQQSPPVQMSAESCLAGWRGFHQALNMPGRYLSAVPMVTDTGACRVDRSVAALRATDFAALEWRATGVEEAIKSQGFPLSVEAHFEGIDPALSFGLHVPEEGQGPNATLQVLAMRDPETRRFEISKMNFDFGVLGRQSMSLSGGGIDLSALSMMQITIGGLRFHQAHLSLESHNGLLSQLLTQFQLDPQAQGWAKLVEGLDPAIFTPGSQEALLAFIAATPNTDGIIELTLSSPNGLGVLPMVGAQKQYTENGPGSIEGLTAALQFVLAGVEIDARWAPAQ